MAIDPRITPLPESIRPTSYENVFRRNLNNIRELFPVDVLVDADSPVYKSNQLFSYVEYLLEESWNEMMRQSFPALANGLSLDYALDILDLPRNPGELDETYRSRRHDPLHALAPNSLDGIEYIIRQFNTDIDKLQVTTDFTYLMQVYPGRSNSQSLTPEERGALQTHLNAPRTGGSGNGFVVNVVTRFPYKTRIRYSYRSQEVEEQVVTGQLRARLYQYVEMLAEPGQFVSKELFLTQAYQIDGIVDASVDLLNFADDSVIAGDIAAVDGRIPICLRTETDVIIEPTDLTPPNVTEE